MGNQLSDGEKVVVSVFIGVLAGGVAGLFFFGGAILEMKDAITDLTVSVAGVKGRVGGIEARISDMQGDISDMQQEIVTFRAEVADRFDRRAPVGDRGCDGNSPRPLAAARQLTAGSDVAPCFAVGQARLPTG